MNGDLPRTLKFAIVWLVLGAIVFVGDQWRRHEALKATFTTASGVVEIRRGEDGHYHWPGTLNGASVDFLVDTGASGVAIPSALAERLRMVALPNLASPLLGMDVLGRLRWQQREGALRIDLGAGDGARTAAP